MQLFSESLLPIPAGKTKCYITGTFRKDTPEEQVRQRMARDLVETYGYPKENVAIEFPIYLGSSRKRVDIAIFEPDKPRTQENINLIVETKSESTKPTAGNGVEQLKSYLSACANAKWGMWLGSELRMYHRLLQDDRINFDFIPEPDIPLFGKSKPTRIHVSKLVPAEGLKGTFRRIHNYIYANEGLPKDLAFNELLKLIFCKAHDEATTRGEMRFDIDEDERMSSLGQQRLKVRLEELFESVKARYGYIFEPHDTLRLNNRVLAYTVSELRRYSLLRTRTDIKGEAYQELVRGNLRGDKGEFFTPDNVCEMAARMVFSLYPHERWESLKVLDPTCGTGGFLRAALNILAEDIKDIELSRGITDPTSVDQAVTAFLKEVCRDNLFGIDINPTLVRAAQMNLVIHGDGSTNIYRQNSLLPSVEWSAEMQRAIPLGSLDIVLTNPPFGSGPGLKVDDKEVLSRYELPTYLGQANMSPEQLFIERCYQFLKPGGYMAIVLPDSILSNPGLGGLRKWILSKCKLIASIDLPLETFVAFSGTGTQTSVLLLQKKTDDELRLEKHSGKPLEYDVFMAMPKTMGYDRRGNYLWRRTPEGLEIEVIGELPLPDGGKMQTKEKLRDDEVSEVLEAFKVWQESRREA